MAVNPVFNRIDKEASQAGYAGFGRQQGYAQQGAYGPPQSRHRSASNTASGCASGRP